MKRMNNNRDTWNSKHYKKYASFQNHEWALTALFESIQFKGDEAILDVGCGNGTLTAKMAQKVTHGQVIGIDLSPSMIKAAQEFFAHVPNISFEVADATNFSFNQKFDCITSFFVLHWVKDQLAVLRNIKKTLKPHGKTLIIMAAEQKDSLISCAFEKLEHKGAWMEAISNNKKKHFSKTVADFGQLLDQANFEHKKIEIVQKSSAAPTLDAAVQTLMRWVPHSTELPYEQALKFSRELGEAMYKQLNKKPQESISFVQHFLLVEAL